MCLSTLQEVRGCPISIFQLRFPSDDIFFWSLCDYLCYAEATLPTICWDRGNARKLQLTAARALGSVSHVPSCVEIVLESSMKRIMIVWSIPRPHCGGDVGSALCKDTYDSEPEHSVSSRLWRYQFFFKADSLYIEAKAKIPSFWFKWGKYNVESSW